MPLPVVPPQPPLAADRPGLGASATPGLRLRRLRGGRVRITFGTAGRRADLERRDGRRWRRLRTAAPAGALTVRVPRRARRAFAVRVRLRTADGRPGAWLVRTL